MRTIWLRRRRFLAGLVALAGPRPTGPCVGAPSRITIAGPDEKGERLRVTGRVFAPDGKRAASGVTVYAYHTDVDGYYNRQRGAAPRLRGFMTTDVEGRFEYLTIRPGPYPQNRVAAHIHHQLWGGGWPAQWSEDILFEGDPFITEAERRSSEAGGRFGSIRAARRTADGTLEIVHDLRLKPEGTSFEDNIRHGLRACGLA